MARCNQGIVERPDILLSPAVVVGLDDADALDAQRGQHGKERLEAHRGGLAVFLWALDEDSGWVVTVNRGFLPSSFPLLCIPLLVFDCVKKEGVLRLGNYSH
jgi:hypothetical protein